MIAGSIYEMGSLIPVETNPSYIITSDTKTSIGTIASGTSDYPYLTIKSPGGTEMLNVCSSGTSLMANGEYIHLSELLKTIRDLEARVLELESKLDNPYPEWK